MRLPICTFAVHLTLMNNSRCLPFCMCIPCDGICADNGLILWFLNRPGTQLSHRGALLRYFPNHARSLSDRPAVPRSPVLRGVAATIAVCIGAGGGGCGKAWSRPFSLLIRSVSAHSSAEELPWSFCIHPSLSLSPSFLSSFC